MLTNPNTTGSFNSSSPVNCSGLPQTIWFLTAFSFINIGLLLPLYLFILFLAFRRRRRQGSSSMLSHSDVFACHMVAMEMVEVLSCLCFCISKFAELPQMMLYSLGAMTTAWCVKLQFHMLTCAELYLAVVYPITYLQLKDSGGIRIRNISVAFAWLLCFVWGILTFLNKVYTVVSLYFFLITAVLILVSFCYISVLWTLKQPGPGDRARDRVQVDQSKQKAFHTIMVIMAVLWLSLGGALVCDAVQTSLALKKNEECVPSLWSLWFSLPSSLVLPLLFLQRAGKLPCSQD